MAEIEDIVHKLESCEYRKEEFTHHMHLAVAAWYLTSLPHEEALDRMRACLLRFTRHHGVTGYHETITRFWLRLVADFLENNTVQDFPARVSTLIECYGNKQTLFDYYSRERVMSEDARNAWVEPDLRSFGQPRRCENSR
jgi:hypothetical protein